MGQQLVRAGQQVLVRDVALRQLLHCAVLLGYVLGSEEGPSPQSGQA